MLHRLFLKPRVFILVPLILILAASVACGDDATPTPAATAVPPTATPTAAPTATPTPEAIVVSGTINVGVKELGVFSTHPRLTGGPINQRFGCCLTEQLVHVDHTRSFVPELAKDWSLAGDGLTWTFKLQEGVQFHQGYGEMTVDDLIWSLEQYAAEDSVSAFAPNLRRLFFNEEGGMTRVDDFTLEVNTGKVQIDMLINAARIQAGGVFSKKQVDDIGEEAANFKGAGTGPWAFEEARSGEFWKFSAVEDHWRKSPEFAELVKWEIPEESTRLANFQTGVIDTMAISLDSLPTIESVAGVKFMQVQGGANLHLNIFGNWHVNAGTPDQAPGFDADLPWVSSNSDVNSPEWETARKVREALALAIDRELIVETILGGQGRTEPVFLWETQVHRLPKDLQAGRAYDPVRAKQLLKEAGYEDGFEINILASVREVPGEVETCSAIAQMWREIGIDAKEQRIPWGTFYPTNRDRTYQGANCHGGGTQLDPIPGMAFGLMSTGAIFNWGFDHPTLDALLAEASGIADDAERFVVAGEVARFVYENVLEIALYSVNLIWPLSDKLDPWLEHLEYVDSRELGGFEYAKHRQ